MRIAAGSSYLQQCIGREKVWVGKGCEQCSRAMMGGQDGGVHAQFFDPNSLSLLCSQKCVSPATGTCVT